MGYEREGGEVWDKRGQGDEMCGGEVWEERGREGEGGVGERVRGKKC